MTRNVSTKILIRYRFIFFLFSLSYGFCGKVCAQKTAVGYSDAGSLGIKYTSRPIKESFIRCSILLRDQDRDGFITEGEDAVLFLSVQNLSDSLTLSTKVDVFTRQNEDGSPIFKLFLTGPISPGDAKSFPDTVHWSGPIPTGIIPYMAHAIETNNLSEPVDVFFPIEFLGSGSLPLELDNEKSGK